MKKVSFLAGLYIIDGAGSAFKKNPGPKSFDRSLSSFSFPTLQYIRVFFVPFEK